MIQAQRVVLHGLGGSGKTESAVRFAEHHRQDYTAIFWVYGADEARLHDGFARIGRAVFSERNESSTDYVNEAQVWFTNNKRWLLIVDNVNDQPALDVLRRRYLKGGMEGHILLTSRNSTASAQWQGIEVADMEQSEAIILLSNITGCEFQAETQVMLDLLADLGHLPLAIDQAGSYIAATEISIGEYYRWFQVEKGRLLRQVPSTLYNYDSQETVMTTWEMSFQRIEEVDSPASQLLLMMAVFSHHDIPLDMLELTDDSLRHWASNGEFEPLPEDQEWVSITMKQTLQSHLRLREALLTLKKYSFIRYKPSGESFSLHPLVHYWASQRLKSYSARQDLIMCSIGVVASSFGKEERMPPFAVPYGSGDVASVLEEKSLRLWPWREYRTLVPHAHHCMHYVTQLDTLTQSMAHLSLSLLQVFEYSSISEEPEQTFKVHRDFAHEIIDFVETRGKDNDHFLDVNIVLWRLTRAVVCTCQKAGIRSTPCPRCKQAFSGATNIWRGLKVSKLDSPKTTARVKAASLCLLLVLFLGGSKLDHLDLFRYAEVRNIAYFRSYRTFSIPNDEPFNTWFSTPSALRSRLEQYVYNFARYLQVRSSSEENKGRIDHNLAKDVSSYYERLCGTNSEEYRRSVWYLTTSFEEKREWSQVEAYLEPLVRISIKAPVNSWSHERCVIRLVDALIHMRREDEAQQILRGIQKAYNDAGNVLPLMRPRYSMGPLHDGVVRTEFLTSLRKCSTVS